MALTLAQYEARVQNLLMDTGAAIFPTATIDEGVRLALHDYSQVAPQEWESVIVLPAAGREIALNSLANLIAVTNVWWPYNTATEEWPPNLVRGFRVWWDNAQPVLFLNTGTYARPMAAGYSDLGAVGLGLTRYSAQPQANDNVRIWWTALHTIQNLDSAGVTTLPALDESLCVLGAAGYACLARGVDLNETSANMGVSTPNYGAFGDLFLKRFRDGLGLVRSRIAARGAEPWGKGWLMDKWDARGDEWLR